MALKDEILELLKIGDMTAQEIGKRLPKYSPSTVKNVMKMLRRDGWIFAVAHQYSGAGKRFVYSLENKVFKKDTIPQRILRSLQGSNRTSKEIAHYTNLPEKQVTAALSRLKDQGRVFIARELEVKGQKAFVYSIEEPLILPTEGSDTRVISGFGAVPRVKDKRTPQEKAFLCVAQRYDQILNEYVRQKHVDF